MKPAIHPNYSEVLIRCVTCRTEFVTRSTKLDTNKVTHNGQEMPSITLEICSNCHPFYSGKQMLVDTAGRVEKFMKRYGQVTSATPKK